MSTTPQVIRTLAVLALMHPATFDRFIRELRAAGLLPTGRRGGKNELHFEAEHLVYVLLALVATLPGEAAQAAKVLSELRCNEIDDEGNVIRAGGPTLFEYLVKVLLKAAEYYRAKARGEEVEPWPPLPHEIDASLIETRRVTVDWSRGKQVQFSAVGTYSTRHTISRWTVFHQPLLIEVAKLLADTLDHFEATTPERKTPGTTGASNTSAPAPTRTNDRSRSRETGPLANPDIKRVCENPQASADSGVGHFLVTTGDGRHARDLRPPPSC